MKISAKNKDSRLLVTVKASFRETFDEKVLDRFGRLCLRCFLQPRLVKGKRVEYFGPSGISLKTRMKKTVTKREFLFILEHIVVATEKLQSNNFPLHDMNLDPQCIYINEATKELQFLYTPVVGAKEGFRLEELFATIAQLCRPEPEEDMEYIVRFHHFFRSMQPFDLSRIERFVQREDKSVVDTIRKYNTGQSGFMTSKHKHYYEHMDRERERQNAPQDSDATGLLSEMDDATGLLNEDVDDATGLLDGYTDPVGDNSDATGILDGGGWDSEATGLLDESGPGAGGGTPAGGMGGWDSEDTGLLNESGPGAGGGTPAGGMGGWDSEATGLLNESGPGAGGSTPTGGGSYGDPDATGILNGGAASGGNSGGWDPEATGLLKERENGARTPDSQPAAPSNAGKAELFRVATGEKIQLYRTVFRIGKDRSTADYCVMDNTSVSRNHADIITRVNGYFVVDQGSTNGTFVNNRMVMAKVETPIHDGDALLFGNERFVFRLTAAGARVCPMCRANAGSANFCPNCGCSLR